MPGRGRPVPAWESTTRSSFPAPRPISCLARTAGRRRLAARSPCRSRTARGSGRRGAAEALGGPRSRPGCLALAVARRRRRDELVEQWRETCATASTARAKAASFAFDGLVEPLILRTYCSAAACTSSSVAGGSKLWRMRMFLHMMPILRLPSPSGPARRRSRLLRASPCGRRPLRRATAGVLARDLDAVDVACVPRAPGSPPRAPGGAWRRRSPSTERRQLLESAHLPDDAVSAAMHARRRPSRAEVHTVSTRSGYASSSASTGVLRAFDIATWTADGPSRGRARSLPAADRLVVRPACSCRTSCCSSSLPRAAGTSTACPKAASTTSVILLDVSVFPATTAAGARAFTSEPSGARTRTGAKAPPQAGMSGSVSRRTTKKHADRVTASGQLRFPGYCGAVPAKSISTLVTRDRHRDPDLEIAVDRLDHVGRLVATVGQSLRRQHARGARSTRAARPSPPRRACGLAARRAPRGVRPRAGAPRPGRGDHRGARRDFASSRRSGRRRPSSRRVGG